MTMVMVAAFASAAMAQSQEEEDAEAIHCMYTLYGTAWEDEMAQTFVAHRSGYLTGVGVDLGSSGDTRGSVQIATVNPEGKPSNNVIASGTYRETGTSDNIDWNAVYPGDPVPAKVVAGQTYAIIVDNEIGMTFWNYAEQSECQGGSFYRTADGTWASAPSSPNSSTREGTNPSFRYTARIDDDETAPTGRIKIDDGAGRTTDRWVKLSLGAQDRAFYADAISGVKYMRFLNANSGEEVTAWEPYSPTKYWQLSSGEGAKTVKVQFKDRAGHRSVFIADSIGFYR